MSAARWLREFSALGLSLLESLLGWVVIGPLTLLVPRRRDWIAVIGRQHGKFLDNAKYFFLQASTAKACRVVFVTERREVQAYLTDSDRQVTRYPTAAAIWYLVRCGNVVVDSTDWGRHLRHYLLLGAHKIQLWHGVGFKRIEADKWRRETGRYRWLSHPWVFRLRMFLYRLNGRHVRYDAVCSTSTFYRENVFEPAFSARHFPVTGYPRNSFGTFGGRSEPLAWRNVDSAIRLSLETWKREHRHIVIIAPTMRDSGTVPMELDPETLTAIDRFCETEGLEFIFKFHPSEASASQIAGEHLHVCDANSDLYPLFPYASALVTDYSSIYMDYLLIDRPTLFLLLDGDSYGREDREIQFDFDAMTPGPKSASWDDLLHSLKNQLEQDTFRQEREHLRQLAFDDLDQQDAVGRLLDFMRVQQWLPTEERP